MNKRSYKCKHARSRTSHKYTRKIRIMFHINFLFTKFKMNFQVREKKWSAFLSFTHKKTRLLKKYCVCYYWMKEKVAFLLNGFSVIGNMVLLNWIVAQKIHIDFNRAIEKRLSRTAISFFSYLFFFLAFTVLAWELKPTFFPVYLILWQRFHVTNAAPLKHPPNWKKNKNKNLDTKISSGQ